MSTEGRVRDQIVAVLLCSVMFVSGADLLIMTPILPQVASEVSVDVDQAGLWVTAYAAATAIVALIFGPISDRKGRRPVLIGGVVVIVVGTLACGFATDFTSMLLARALAGSGAGMLVTSTTSFVGDHFDGERRAIVMGYVMSGFFLSLILAMPIGAFLADRYGWQNMFLIFSGIALAVGVALVIFLPNPRHEERESEATFRSAARTYGELIRDRKVLGILLMSASIGLSMTMFSVYASPWMEQTFGLSTAERGLVYAAGGPAVFLGGPVAGRLSNRVGRVRLVVGASLLMAIMQLAMTRSHAVSVAASGWLGNIESFSHFGHGPWPVVVPTLIVFFFVMLAGSGRSTPFQTLALEVVAPERRGSLSAIRNTFNQGGSASGAGLGAVLWATTGGNYDVVCYVAAALSVVGAIALAGLTGDDRKPSTPT